MTRTEVALLVTAAVILVVLGFAAGHGCRPPPPPPPSSTVTGIDAGPGERTIDDRLDGSVQYNEQLMQGIEHKFQDDIAAFDDQQRADYQRLRGQDLEAAARSLSDWNHQRRADAGASSTTSP